MRTGGPAAFHGSGPIVCSTSSTPWPRCVTGSPRQSIRQMSTCSSSRRTRRLCSMPHAAHSRSADGRLQPTPSPRTTRPRDSASTFAIWCASTTGCRRAGRSTAVPSRTRDVIAARYASVVSGSSRGLATTLSPTQAASYPASSAWRAIVQHSSTGGRRADCMTTPRVGMRMPSRMPGASVLRLLGRGGFSADELAQRDHEPLGIELEVRAPLGDPALAVDQHHEASVDDALVRDGAEAEGANHAAHVVRCARQEVPGREIDPVPVRVARRDLGPIGHGIGRDGDEARAVVELRGADAGLGPGELCGDERARLDARREDEADDDGPTPQALRLHDRARLIDQCERWHHLRTASRAGGQEQEARERGRRRSHVVATDQAGSSPRARATMASTISAYPAGINTGSRLPNHWSVVVETPATASSTPKEPRPQCVSEDTLAPSRPTTPPPPSIASRGPSSRTPAARSRARLDPRAAALLPDLGEHTRLEGHELCGGDDLGGPRPRQLHRHEIADLAGARGHDDDPIGEEDRLVDVVRDEEHRRLHLAPDAEQKLLHRQPRLSVERAEGLVHG